MNAEIIPLTGGLNTDIAPQLIAKGDYIDALNIESISVTGANMSAAKSTSPGNQPFPLGDYTLPDGFNMVVGAIADPKRNRIIDFLYNDSNACQIRWWDFNTKTVKIILNDASDQTLGDSAILNFDKDHKITSINILHRSSDEGDLLFWTDGFNPPREINIDKCIAATGDYAALSSEDISQIKQPPLMPITGGYTNDTTHKANNLRDKLFQFAYRYIYDDYAPSTYSPWSKVFLPVGVTDPDKDPVSTNNNKIALSIAAPANLVDKIEIICRESAGQSEWGNPVLIGTIDVDGSPNYASNFYNDGSYPPVNIAEISELYSYLPDLSQCQHLVNGNVIIHGNITEGYDYADVTPDVTMQPFSDDYVTVGVGNLIPLTTADFSITIDYTDDNTGIKFTVSYDTTKTAISGTANVTLHFSGKYTKIPLHWPHSARFLGTINFVFTDSQPTQDKTVFPMGAFGDKILTTQTQASISTVTGNRANNGFSFITQPKYDWASHYQFGLIYYDKNGKTNSVYTDKNMSVITPYPIIQKSSKEIHVAPPLIDGSINHLPPSWAASYAWVRSKNLSESFALYWHCLNVMTDDEFVYIDISNLAFYFENVNPSTNFKYDFAPGDKMSFLYYGTSGSPAYLTNEYSIVDLVENPKIGAQDGLTGFQIINPGYGYVSEPTIHLDGDGTGAKAHAVMKDGHLDHIVIDDPGNGYSRISVTFTGGGSSGAVPAQAYAIVGYQPGTFLKINKDKNTYPAEDVIIKIFRPAQIATDKDTIFYEFGEQYPIITDATGKRYHGGMIQDQGANQPATFIFKEGDYFLSTILTPSSLVNKPTTFFTDVLMTMNYDDNFPSGQNSNGRAVSIFTNSKRLNYPTLVRFSGAYLQDSYVNKLSLYSDSDRDEYNRSYGAL